MSSPAKETRVQVQEQMLQFVTGFWMSRAVYVFAKLGIADLLQSGPKTAEELAEDTGTHAPSLFRILRALVTAGVALPEKSVSELLLCVLCASVVQ